jgi:hypothetical protein
MIRAVRSAFPLTPAQALAVVTDPVLPALTFASTYTLTVIPNAAIMMIADILPTIMRIFFPIMLIFSAVKPVLFTVGFVFEPVFGAAVMTAVPDVFTPVPNVFLPITNILPTVLDIFISVPDVFPQIPPFFDGHLGMPLMKLVHPP